MKLEIKDITPKEAAAVSEALQTHGFQYDVDHTMLYGEAWKMVGVQLMTHHEIQFLVAQRTMKTMGG